MSFDAICESSERNDLSVDLVLIRAGQLLLCWCIICLLL